jgi:carbamoylphosphate synthase large subunit
MNIEESGGKLMAIERNGWNESMKKKCRNLEMKWKKMKKKASEK